MKAITTRSGVAYEGPSIPTNPSPKKVLKSHKNGPLLLWKIKHRHPKVIKKVLKLLDAEMIYPDIRQPWVSPVHLCSKEREGIVLGHKILKSGIEVDHAKVDVIAKLPHPTTVKGVRSFLGHAGNGLGIYFWDDIWEWVTKPRGRVHKEIEELINVLQNVSISIDCKDVWRWNAQDDGKFMDRFVESVKSRFGPSKYGDPQGVLSKLLQLGTVEDYQWEFEKLMNRVTYIPDSLLISFYISRLKLNLQHELLVSRPTTLGDAFSLARSTEARFEAIAEKEQNIKEKADTTLSLPIKEVSRVVKGPLDANEDTLLSLRRPVDEVSSIIKDVFDINESNVECMQVRGKFAEFFEDKGSVEKVLSATKLPEGGNSHSAYSPYRLEDKVNLEGVRNVTPWEAKFGRRKKVKCYVQGSRRQKRKKVIGRDNGRQFAIVTPPNEAWMEYVFGGVTS
ncbi:hypothetical protein Tco_1166063 [Tanacetum coccineum]